MQRAQKAESIETLKGVFDGAGAVVVTHYMGLTVAEMTDLRGRLRKEGAQLKVVKNTPGAEGAERLGRRSGRRPLQGPGRHRLCPGSGLRRQGRDPVRQGQREVHRCRRPDGRGGAGAKASIDALATLPSLDQLRAKLIGLLQAPGDQDRRRPAGPGRPARPRLRRLRRQRRRLIVTFRKHTPNL